jgi:protein SCO1
MPIGAAVLCSVMKAIAAIFLTIFLGCKGYHYDSRYKIVNTVSDFTLLDQHGDRFMLSGPADTAIQLKILYFGYSSCPDFCATTLQKLSQTYGYLSASEKQKVQIIFVSVDPTDSPEMLRNFMKAFDPAIIALSGEGNTIKRLVSNFHVVVAPQRKQVGKNTPKLIDHTGSLFWVENGHEIARQIPGTFSARFLAEDMQKYIH